MGVSCSSHTPPVAEDHHQDHQPITPSRQQSTTQIDVNCNVPPQSSPLKRVPELASVAPHISVIAENMPKSATGPNTRRRRSAPRENKWESVLVAPNEKVIIKRSAARPAAPLHRRGGSPTHFDDVPFSPLHLMQRTSVISDQDVSSSNAATPKHVNQSTQPYSAMGSFPAMIKSQSFHEGDNRSVTFTIEDNHFHQDHRDHHELDAFSDY